MNTTTNNVQLGFYRCSIAIEKDRNEKLLCNEVLIFQKNMIAMFFLKREDLQVVRSYKLRGAYNMMSSLPKEQLERGVVCASAGNHAQGFAFSCKKAKCKRCCIHAQPSLLTRK
jgi:threonine dehydratase